MSKYEIDLAGKLYACDYAVAFIDLLGQGAALCDRHLPDDDVKIIELMKKSVGRIIDLQKSVDTFYRAYKDSPSLYSNLSESEQQLIRDAAPGELKQQSFSDGLVVYVPLGEGATPAPANSIFAMLIMAGQLCLLGLACEAPLRIGIDVAWAVEYGPNVYGAAVAHAYNLESKVAQWPRVVVGRGLVDYLEEHARNAKTQSLALRGVIATRCLKLISKDIIDQRDIVDYLGPEYRSIAKDASHKFVANKAKDYIFEQISHWGKEKDSKLEYRYRSLLRYFEIPR